MVENETLGGSLLVVPRCELDCGPQDCGLDGGPQIGRQRGQTVGRLAGQVRREKGGPLSGRQDGARGQCCDHWNVLWDGVHVQPSECHGE